MTRYRSCAKWPKEVYSGADGSCISTDTHDFESEALSVCRLLEKDGFGGDRRFFPEKTWVEPIEEIHNLI